MENAQLISIDDLATVGHELVEGDLTLVAGGRPTVSAGVGAKVTDGDKGKGYEVSATLTFTWGK